MIVWKNFLYRSPSSRRRVLATSEYLIQMRKQKKEKGFFQNERQKMTHVSVFSSL